MGGRGSGTNPNSWGNSKKGVPRNSSPEQRRAAFRAAVALSKEIKQAISEIDTETGETWARSIALQLRKLARGPLNGFPSTKAIEIIFERTEGAVPQKIDMNVSNASREEQAASILANLELLADSSDDDKSPVN